MNLCYACDERMAKYLHATICRALTMSPSIDKVYVGVDFETTKEELRLDDDRVELLDMRMVKEDLDFYYNHDDDNVPQAIIDDYVEQLNKIAPDMTMEEKIAYGRHSNKKWGAMSFARYYFPIMLPDVKSALYLDVDTWINKDLNELSKFDISKYMVAGVREDKLSAFYSSEAEKTFNYLNSGVLYMNFDMFRKTEFMEHVKESLRTGDFFALPDQDLMNALCQKYMFTMNSAYNCFEKTRECKKPAIVHCNPVKQWDERSPYYKEFLEFDSMDIKEANYINFLFMRNGTPVDFNVVEEKETEVDENGDFICQICHKSITELADVKKIIKVGKDGKDRSVYCHEACEEDPAKGILERYKK